MLWAIVAPAIATVKGIELFDVGLDKVLVPACSILCQPKVGKNPEP